MELPGQDDLVRPCRIKGILHAHSRWTNGAHSLASMVETAREIGLEYLGISDHLLSPAHQEGMDLDAASVQLAEIQRLRDQFQDFDILQGIEIDADPDGELPVDDDVLGRFDYVIVAFPENGGYDPDKFTGQVIRVALHPRVTILSRPLSELILRRQNGVLDMEAVLQAAADGRTVLEVTANPTSHQLDWTHCRRAQDLGVLMAISPDAHRAARLVDYRHGAERAREAGLRCASVLNTLSSEQLRGYLNSGPR